LNAVRAEAVKNDLAAAGDRTPPYAKFAQKKSKHKMNQIPGCGVFINGTNRVA
jgi:hypothetical protein